MKKIILITITTFAFLYSNAQDITYAAKAGLNATISKMNNDSDQRVGFYIGLAVGDFEVSEKILVQPELLYARVSEDGESTSFIQIPIMIKYQLIENLHLQAGPQINYLLEEAVDNFTNFGLDLAVGASYDIKENIFVDVRYSLNLNNRYTGPSDLSLKFNGFQMGVAYKFN